MRSHPLKRIGLLSESRRSNTRACTGASPATIINSDPSPAERCWSIASVGTFRSPFFPTRSTTKTGRGAGRRHSRSLTEKKKKKALRKRGQLGRRLLLDVPVHVSPSPPRDASSGDGVSTYFSYYISPRTIIYSGKVKPLVGGERGCRGGGGGA